MEITKKMTKKEIKKTYKKIYKNIEYIKEEIQENNKKLEQFSVCLCLEDAMIQHELIEDNYMLNYDIQDLSAEIEQLKNIKIKGE